MVLWKQIFVKNNTVGLTGYLMMLLSERLHNAKSDWKLFMNAGIVKDFVVSCDLLEGATLIFETKGITKYAE
jgi:hypothetical protein